MDRKPKDLNYDEEMLETLGATPFTLRKDTLDDNIHTWTTRKRFFPEEMQEHKKIMNYVFGNLKKVGLDEIIAPDQPKDSELCHELTYEEVLKDYKTPIAHEDGTQWLVPKNYESVFLTRETHYQVMEDMGRNISLVFSAADCAIVRMYDKEKDVIGLTHSDLKHTSTNIVGSMVEYMKEHFGSKPENIMVFVGAFAHDGMIWDKVPPYLVDYPEVWTGYIEKIDDTNYEIKYGNKLYDQLVESGISKENIYFDPDNTVKNENYFSNNRSRNTNTQEGRGMFGITFDGLPVYENVEKGKTKTRLK